MEGSFIHTDPLPLKWLALVHFAVLTCKYDQFFVSCAQLVFLEVLYPDKIVAFLDLTLSLHCFFTSTCLQIPYISTEKAGENFGEFKKMKKITHSHYIGGKSQRKLSHTSVEQVMDPT